MADERELMTSNFLQELEVPLRVHPLISPWVVTFQVMFAAVGICRTSGVRFSSIPGMPNVVPGIELTGSHSPNVILNANHLLSKTQEASNAQIHDLFRPLCRALAVRGWDILQQEANIRATDPRPSVQFMRHIRNGASHGNRFNFRGPEPRRPAIWRDLEITKELHGEPVFFAFLNYADLLWLLKDVFDEVIAVPESPAS